MLRVGICNNEIEASMELEKMITIITKEYGIKVDIEIWYSGNEFINDIKKVTETELLFLNTELPDINGIEVGRMIREMNNYRMLIAYTSSTKKHIMKLFQNQPIAFLVQPIKRKDLEEVIIKGYNRFVDNGLLFEYKKRQNIYHLNYEEIIYFESKRKKIAIELVNGSRDEFYGKLADVSSKLPGNFSYIHRSYIINLNYIKKYSHDELVMFNNKILPVSKMYRSKLRAKVQMQ